MLRGVLAGLGILFSLGAISAAVDVSPPPQLAGKSIALLAEGKVVVVDVGNGEVIAERVASEQSRYALTTGRLARRPPNGDEVFAVLPDGNVPVLTALNLKTLTLRRVGQLPAAEYRGLAVGGVTGRVYAFGASSSSVLVIDPLNGSVLQHFQDGTGRDNYSGAVSPDERRIYVSYHGNASGVGVFDVTGNEWRQAYTIQSHGNFAVTGDTVVAATGGENLIEVDGNGRKLRDIPTLLHGNHLMEFALDYKRRVYAVGSCGYAGGYSRTGFEPGAVATVLIPVSPPPYRLPHPVFEVCGERINVAVDGSWAAIAVLRAAVYPSIPTIPGSMLIIGAQSGAVLRTIPTSSEVVDVMAIK